VSLATRLLGANPGAQVTTALTGALTTPGAKGAFIEPGTFQSIQTYSLASATSTITFSSIPQDFKHLQLRHIARSTNASTSGNMYIQFNSDAGNNYAWHRFEAFGNGITSGGAASQPAFAVGGLMNGANSITNAFGCGILDILDYTNTNKLKTMRTLTGYENNGTGSAGNDQGYLNLASSLWFKAGSGVTGDAITSITITVNGGGNFAIYSQFALYGIKG
jgi:hypothetical protein